MEKWKKSKKKMNDEWAEKEEENDDDLGHLIESRMFLWKWWMATSEKMTVRWARRK